MLLGLARPPAQDLGNGTLTDLEPVPDADRRPTEGPQCLLTNLSRYRRFPKPLHGDDVAVDVSLDQAPEPGVSYYIGVRDFAQEFIHLHKISSVRMSRKMLHTSQRVGLL